MSKLHGAVTLQYDSIMRESLTHIMLNTNEGRFIFEKKDININEHAKRVHLPEWLAIDIGIRECKFP